MTSEAERKTLETWKRLERHRMLRDPHPTVIRKLLERLGVIPGLAANDPIRALWEPGFGSDGSYREQGRRNLQRMAQRVLAVSRKAEAAK